MTFLSWFRQSKTSLPAMDHPVFGKIGATLEVREEVYFWEMQDDLVTEKGNISVFFDAAATGPSADQVAMWHRVFTDFDDYFTLAKPLLKARLDEFGLGDRINDLPWTGVGLAADGKDTSPWDLSFDVAYKIFTVCFEQGHPSFVTCDS